MATDPKRCQGYAQVLYINCGKGTNRETGLSKKAVSAAKSAMPTNLRSR